MGEERLRRAAEEFYSEYAHGMLPKGLLGTPAECLAKPIARVFGIEVEVVDLSVPFWEGAPTWPYAAENPQITRVRSHARDRVLAHRICTTMHMATHIDAPIHVEEGFPSIDQIPLERFIGEGVVVSIPKKEWEVITPEDLENAKPEIQENDIVVINSGWHKYYGDNTKYFCYSPGLYKEAAEWFVKKRVKGVAVDQQAIDHPLGTRLVQPKGAQPLLPWLIEEYKKRTGRDVYEDFPYWEPAHRILYTHGIFGIERAGGDIDKVTGKRCVIVAFPIKWIGGDASLVRLVALVKKGEI